MTSEGVRRKPPRKGGARIEKTTTLHIFTMVFFGRRILVYYTKGRYSTVMCMIRHTSFCLSFIHPLFPFSPIISSLRERERERKAAREFAELSTEWAILDTQLVDELIPLT